MGIYLKTLISLTFLRLLVDRGFVCFWEFALLPHRQDDPYECELVRRHLFPAENLLEPLARLEDCDSYQRDSRMQWQEIGRIVHLTGQAVAVRIRSMQDEGIIEAFTVNLNHEKLGRPIFPLITVFMSSTNHVSFQRFLSDSQVLLWAICTI